MLFLLAMSAQAMTVEVKVAQPDASAILSRLESQTGLNFSAHCPSLTAQGKACQEEELHGTLSTRDGLVRVEVYEGKGGDPRIKPTNADRKKLRAAIVKAVLGNP